MGKRKKIGEACAQDKDCGSKICRPTDVTDSDGEKQCVGKATLKGPCRKDTDCRGAAYCDKPPDAPAEAFAGQCKPNKTSTPTRPPKKKKKSKPVKKALAECSGKSAKSCMSDSKQKKKPHCFFVKEVTKKQGRKVPTECTNVLQGFDTYKGKLEDSLNDLNAELINLMENVADKDRPAVRQLLLKNSSNAFQDHEYEYVLLLLSNRYGNDIATWLHDALDEDNEIKTFHGFSNKRKVFVLFNLLETLQVEVSKIKSMMATKKKKGGKKSKYVAFTMHFPHFFRYKYKYVDQGYTPEAGFCKGTKGVCVINETVDLNKRTYLPKCKTTTICNVSETISGGKTYQLKDAEYQQEELYVLPQKTRGNLRVGGREDFTTPTKYMSFMNVYKYEMVNGHLMTKVPTVLKTIEALDARDLSGSRGYQRHCIFTQTNLIMNMLPYFVANGYFIPNRLPSPRDTDDYEWFLLARNATVRRQNNGMLEIQWPEKSDYGYYVPENVTTVEPKENFLIQDGEGNDVNVTNACCQVNLYAPYHKRIVYLYSDKTGKDIIGNTNMYVNDGHKKEFTKNFFNNDLQSAHIIIIDQTQKEGLSLYDVAYMHINEVVTNIGDYEQATARVARRCKSQRLPTIRFQKAFGSEFNLRFVSVFMYDSTFPSQQCFLKNAVDPNDSSQLYYKEKHSDKLYVRTITGKLMCRGMEDSSGALVFPSDSVLKLIDQIFDQFTFSERQERRIRKSLTISFDSFYRALANRDDLTKIITVMNEWMKRYSFDYSQKKALEDLDLQNIIHDDFRLANQAYKDTFLRKTTPNFVVPTFQLPDYTNIPAYQGTLSFMYPPLFAFIFKRLKLLFPNELKVLSFPGGNIQNELIWEATIFLPNKNPPALGTSQLSNTKVVMEAVETLLNDNTGLRYLVVSMTLKSAKEYESSSNHQNALIFYKQVLGNGKFQFIVERFEPNGFDDEQFRPALLNLEMEKMLTTLKTHLYEKYKPVVVDFTYVTPLDQCAFNLNFSSLTAAGYCVPWSVFYLDYRLMNPQADATELIEFIRQQWQDTELHKSFIESYSSAALQFFDDLNVEMTKRHRKQGTTISTIYRQFKTLSETAQEQLINAIMGNDQSIQEADEKTKKLQMDNNKERNDDSDNKNPPEDKNESTEMILNNFRIMLQGLYDRYLKLTTDSEDKKAKLQWALKKDLDFFDDLRSEDPALLKSYINDIDTIPEFKSFFYIYKMMQELLSQDDMLELAYNTLSASEFKTKYIGITRKKISELNNILNVVSRWYPKPPHTETYNFWTMFWRILPKSRYLYTTKHKIEASKEEWEEIEKEIDNDELYGILKDLEKCILTEDNLKKYKKGKIRMVLAPFVTFNEPYREVVFLDANLSKEVIDYYFFQPWSHLYEQDYKIGLVLGRAYEKQFKKYARLTVSDDYQTPQYGQALDNLKTNRYIGYGQLCHIWFNVNNQLFNTLEKLNSNFLEYFNTLCKYLGNNPIDENTLKEYDESNDANEQETNNDISLQGGDCACETACEDALARKFQDISLTPNEFDKMQVMGYKELRPREIEQKPSLLDKYIRWYASEKIDGWQAIWDGKGTLYTKTYKRTFAVPDRWMKLLPKIPMTGEIKIKGQPATKTASLMKDNPLWDKTYFHVFDVVGRNHINKPFRERVRIVEQTVKNACQSIPDCPLIAAPQIIMQSREDIVTFYKKVLEKGGEGLVITAPESIYDAGKKRSNERVKLKGRNDAEGEVIGYNMGGENGLKSLHLAFNGITFDLGIGFKHVHRQHPTAYFPLGTMVTFSYRELNENGKPKEARFVAVRCDI